MQSATRCRRDKHTTRVTICSSVIKGTGWIGCLDAHWEQAGRLLFCTDLQTCCLGSGNLPLLVLNIELDRVAHDTCVDLLVMFPQELEDVLEGQWFSL